MSVPRLLMRARCSDEITKDGISVTPWVFPKQKEATELAK